MPQVADRIALTYRTVTILHDRPVTSDVFFIIDIDVLQPFFAEVRGIRIEGIQSPVTCIPCRHGAVKNFVPEIKTAGDIFRMADAKRMDRKFPRDQTACMFQYVI